MVIQVVNQALLKEYSTHNIETIVIKPDHSRFNLNAPAPVQEMGERDAANTLRQTIGDQSIEQSLRTRSNDLDFGKSRDVHEANAFTNGFHFMTDYVMHHVTRKTVVVALFDAVPGKPARPFVTKDFFVNGAFCLEPFV